MKLRDALAGIIFAIGLPVGFAFTPTTFTIPIADFTFDPNNQCFNGGGSFSCFSNGYGEASFTVPQSGYYSVSIPFFVQFGSSGYFAPFIDNIPLDHGIDTTTGSDYVFLADTEPSPGVVPSKYLTAGTHTLMIAPQFTASVQVGFSPPTITLVSASSLPSEPAGARDPTIQPFRSFSIWNTAIGSSATWSSPTDADQTTLNGLFGVVNAGSFSEPIYVAASGDPAITATQVWNGAPTLLAPVTTPANTAFTVANGSDHNWVMYDSTHSFILDGYNCGISSSPYQIGCSPMVEESVCDGIDPGAALGGVPGVMRVSEIQAAAYHHMLQYSLSKDAVKAPSAIWAVAWPQWIIDGCATGCYTGGANGIQPGVTIGIPSTVNINSLGLTADGLAVAKVLQDYGAMERATGGTTQWTLVAEQAADAGCCTTQMANIRGDMAKIVAVLAIMRNQGPTSINGGGTPRVAAIGRIDTSICP